MDSVRLLGDSVPKQGIRALIVFNDALDLGWNLKHPSIKLPKRGNAKRARRQAPTVSRHCILAVEKASIDGDQPCGIRLFWSRYLLTALASLRFADTIEIALTFTTDTALAVRSADQKNPRWEHIWRATPRVGFQSNGAWVSLLCGYWETAKPSKEGRYRYLFPYFNPIVWNWLQPKGIARRYPGGAHAVRGFPGIHKSVKTTHG